MENQHRQIKQYRELNNEEIDTMNAFRDFEEQLASLVRDSEGYDPRWLAIAKTHWQQGFMAITRAIAKPDSPWL